jgi:hypothetical protein
MSVALNVVKMRLLSPNVIGVEKNISAIRRVFEEAGVKE